MVVGFCEEKMLLKTFITDSKSLKNVSYYSYYFSTEEIQQSRGYKKQTEKHLKIATKNPNPNTFPKTEFKGGYLSDVTHIKKGISFYIKELTLSFP